MADFTKLLDKIDLMQLAEQAGAHFGRNGHGHEHRAACPLHHGKNPTSFRVYDNRKGDRRQLWRCYGDCGAGGDAITFYQKWQGVDFIRAVQDLAARAHMSLEELGFSRDDLEREKEQRRRSDVLDEAARFYHRQLRNNRDPLARYGMRYLLKRGFTRRTIRQAGFGLTITDDALAKHLESHGFDMALARELGLIRADGRDFTANANGLFAGPYGWIVYPHRYGNRTVYLSTRAVEIDNGDRPDPKDKSRNIPGARQVYWAHAAGCDSVVIVEGPADAESLRQVGQTALALCGLGEMPEQEIDRLHKRDAVYLAVDNDTAAAQKLAALDSSITRLLHDLGPLTRITSAGEGKDWNDWLRSGKLTPETLRGHLAQSLPWITVRLRQCELLNNPDELDERMNEIGELLSMLPMATQLKYAKQAAKAMGVNLADVRRLIAQAHNGNGNGQCLSSVKDGRLNFLGETLANFQASITHELILDDGENAPVCHYTITGQLDSKQPLEPVEISAEEFPAMAWIPRHWGARAIVHIPKGRFSTLARAIQEISLEALVRERVYQFTGWASIDGRRSFLSASGALHAEGLDQSIRVDLGGNNLRHYSLPAPAGGDATAQAVKASVGFLDLADRRVSAPLWAAMYAAPLTSIRSLNAVMWVYGPTQSGKSTITHLALAHYGQGFVSGREYHAPMDWTSTSTALEGALFRSKDTCLVIDDFAPQFTSRAEALSMHKKAHLMARSVGNRSSRGRARADLSEQVTRVPRGLAIATAENPLMGQSIVGRMIYVTVEHGQVMARGANSQLDAGQQAAQAGQYAQAMTAYIQWLAANWDKAKDLFLQTLEDSVTFARTDGRLQNRLPDYFAVLDAAQQVALRAFHELGFISQHEMDVHIGENSEALMAVIAGQAEKIALESPVRKFFEALSNLLARKQVYLAPRKQEVEYHPPERAELIGYYEPYDNTVIYLNPEDCLQHAKAYWRELDENMDILPDALNRQIAQVPGLLKERGTDSRLKVSKFCCGKTRWVLAIDAQRAGELYSVDLSNENRLAAADPNEPGDPPFPI